MAQVVIEHHLPSDEIRAYVETSTGQFQVMTDERGRPVDFRSEVQRSGRSAAAVQRALQAASRFFV